jgi:hypothetical protein
MCAENMAGVRLIKGHTEKRLLPEKMTPWLWAAKGIWALNTSVRLLSLIHTLAMINYEGMLCLQRLALSSGTFLLRG